ncbi:MAG: DNA cytosine methyltransferase [Patescibacteria group bacterium]|nr:DNA cytosine methyltransferase [Patescibacteria group bacterium]
MPRAYYNEIDLFCAEWLYNLQRENLIAPGDIDTRPIQDVRPSDLKGYTQHHFFAGIGGWSYALRQAHWPDHREVWTGSCPCQPFSLAGKRGGFADDRHLWPCWRYLIAVGRPAIVLGEQVASASQWLRLVRSDLETLGYAVGAMPIEAASAGADHKRDRFWIVANNGRGRRFGSGEGQGQFERRTEVVGASNLDLAHHHHQRLERSAGTSIQGGMSRSAFGSGAKPKGSMADDDDARSQGRSLPTQCSIERVARQDGLADSDFFFKGNEELQRGGQRRGAGGDPQTRPRCHEHCETGSCCFNPNECDGQNCWLLSNAERIEFRGERPNTAFGASSGMQGTDKQRERLRPDTRPVCNVGEFEWVIGADGKARRVKPGVRLLAHGIPNRVGKLRGFGNAIDHRPAKAFIESVMDILDTRNSS